MSVKAPYIEHSFKINFKRYGEPIFIRTFSDLHFDASNCAKAEVEEFFQQCKKDLKTKNIYFLGNGDYADAFSFTERDHLNIYSSKLHETTRNMFGNIAEQSTLKLYERMKFMSNRIIGLGEGNHFAMFPNVVMTTTQWLCLLLNCKYLGCPSYTTLQFCNESKDNTTLLRTIFMHHGLSGGGRTPGITLNQIGHMTSIAEADIFVMAHDHQIAFKKESRLVGPHRFGLPVRSRDMVFLRTGGYQKSYENGMNSFASERLMKPSTFGSPYIILTPIRKQEMDGDVVDIKIDVATRL